MRAALEGLLACLPRCCACAVEIGVIIDMYRWPLCERCWLSMPGSDTDKPVADMRAAVAFAKGRLAKEEDEEEG